MLYHSLSIHLNKCKLTGIPLKPNSKKRNTANNVATITLLEEINCEPLTPTFLPKKPGTIEPNKGKIIILKYIIYILLLYFLLIYRKLLKYLNLLQILLLLLLLYI